MLIIKILAVICVLPEILMAILKLDKKYMFYPFIINALLIVSTCIYALCKYINTPIASLPIYYYILLEIYPLIISILIICTLLIFKRKK